MVVQGDAGPQFIFSKLPGVVPKTLPRNPTHTSVTFLIVGLHAIDGNSALQFLFVKKLKTATMNPETLSLHGFTAKNLAELVFYVACGILVLDFVHLIFIPSSTGVKTNFFEADIRPASVRQ